MTFPDWFRLTKLPLSILISVSALFGYAYGSVPASAPVGAGVFWGTLFIVFAGAVFNNVQDARLDATMERTRVRPLPAGHTTRIAAVAWSALFAAMGFSILAWLPHGASVLLMGALGLLLYNGVYTPLKRRSTLAILPGALCGVCPPAMGWLAAGRSLAEWEFAILGALLFFWQIPHFWLILLRRRQDYRAAGLPNMLQVLGETQLVRMCVAWVVSFSLVASLVVSGPHVQLVGTRVFVLLCSTAIAVSTFRLLWKRSPGQVKGVFIQLNATLGLVMLAIIMDRAIPLILLHRGG